MRALPERLETDWRKAACDPEGLVEYKLEPLTNRLVLHIGTRANRSDGIDEAGSVFDAVAFGLKDIKGLTYENGMPFSLEFEQVKIGRTNIRRVKDKCIDQLPYSLLLEISNAVSEISGLTSKEADEIKNTSGSPVQTSTVEDAPEMYQDVDTIASMEESQSDCTLMNTDG